MSSSIQEYKAIAVSGMTDSNRKEGVSIQLRVAYISASI
jgi:hypothetical protein